MIVPLAPEAAAAANFSVGRSAVELHSPRRLRRRQDKIRFVLVRHEEGAAFMASGYAKFTGKLGVCVSTAGPGAVHLLNGLYEAKFDGAPVLATPGAAP